MPRSKLHHYNGENLQFARSLRKEMSVAEEWLWSRLRNQKTGFRFRRQVPIGRYVLDFYCPEVNLCIEVDGEQHQLRTTQDSRRDAFLKENNIYTIRIPSLDIFSSDTNNISSWVDQILEYCEQVSGRQAIRVFEMESDRRFQGPKEL